MDQLQVRPDRLYLGWQYSLVQPDPGPSPRRPAPPAQVQLDPGWEAAQRRECSRLSRPLKLACAGSAALVGLALALGLAGALDSWLGGLGILAGLAGAAVGWRGIRRDERDLRAAIAAEHRRVATIRAAQQSRLAARQKLHARQFRAWQARRAAFERQLQWYAVSLPAEIDRVDVAGGTLSGWSAMLTMIAAPRLSAGSEVTVLDLTEGAVARDLLAVARQSGIEPLVWVLPGDLPRLDLGAGLGREALADLLSATVSASDDPGSAGDPSKDSALLDRVVEVLGGDPTIAGVTAALRALAQIGDPRDDLRAGLLTAEQLERLTTLFGRGATDRVVIDRAWALESRLRKLDRLGSAAVALPPSRLRVAWLDRRAGVVANKVLATYMTVALTHMLRQAPAGRRWQRTLCVLGAERLSGEVIDRLCDAGEISGTGLVIAYRSLPGPVAERLGRGNAAVAFMRLGNSQDAKVASEQIGTEQRFVVSQLTDTVGTSFTDTGGDSYTSTVGSADSVSDSVSVTQNSGRSRGRGRSRAGGSGPFGDFTGSVSRDASHSTGTSDSRSITAGISSGTSWGYSTSMAAGANESVSRTAQRSREFLVEAHELQQLPPSAVLVTYASREGRRVVLADANPGIFALRTATLLSLEEARAASSGSWQQDRQGAGRAARPGTAPGRPGGPGAQRPGAAPSGTGPGAPGPFGSRPAPDGFGQRAGDHPSAAQPPPNLGPAPERLDWRTPRD